MKSISGWLAGFLFLVWSLVQPFVVVGQSETANKFLLGNLPDIPDAVGLAGPFCGVLEGQLLVAGGANFPDAKPWEGGKKKWHRVVYCLTKGNNQWRLVGELPNELAYGGSVSLREGIVLIGGSDAERHYSDVWLMRMNGDQVQFKKGPSLPVPLATFAATVLDNRIYVIGGASEPGEKSASSQMYSLELNARGFDASATWREEASIPGGGRILPNIATLGKELFVFGGAALEESEGKTRRRYLSDAWRWNRATGWKQVADMPFPLAASPVPSPALGPSHFLVLGGDDGSKAGFQPVEQHPGFNNNLLAYHSVTDTWTTFGTIDQPAVTTGVVRWGDAWVIPSGEIRPGVRTPRVSTIALALHRPEFGWVNYGVLTGYLLLVLILGLVSAGPVATTSQFFRADQTIPWWAAGLSIFATMLSSITFMSIPAQGYSVGWNLFVGSIYVVLTPLIVRVFLPFYRRLDVTSAYEYLERRFNLAVRLFASLQFMLFQLGRIAVVLFLPSLALSTVAGINILVSILAVGALCVVYTMFGGMRAVIWTDAIQAVILMGGAIWGLITLVRRVPGGITEIVTVARTHDRFFETLSWSWDWTLVTGWVIILGSLFSNLFSYTASQDVVQRYLTTSDERMAGRAIWTNAFLAPVAQAIFFAIGTALFAFYVSFPERLHASIANDGIFPYFVVSELPTGLAGLIFAGVFAASQSTVSSSLNSFSTAYVTDFHRRFRPQTDDRSALQLARWITLAVGVLGIALAIVLALVGDIRSLWETFMAVLGLFGGSVSGLFLLGIFTRRVHGAAAMVGAILAVVIVFLLFIKGVSFWWFSIAGVSSCVTLGYLASFLIPGTARFEHLTLYSMPQGDTKK